MSKTRDLVVTGLTLIAMSTIVVGPAAAAAPITAPTTAPAPKTTARMPTAVQKIANGSVQVGTQCKGEFPNYDRTMTFFDRPSSICVRWEDRDPVASAVWELWKHKPGGADQKVASGDVPAATLSAGTHSTFNISLNALPLHNDTTADQKYFVKVLSKRNAADTGSLTSARGTLIHQPKANEPKPQPADPYKCSAAPDQYKRTVSLTIPKMTVNQTTSTAGDGDRDELYIKVDRLGPGNDDGAKRLPGNDDYYEAKQSQSSSSKWTNKDQKNVGRPNLWSGTLKHGQKVTLAVTAMEQDNSELSDIRASLMEAMEQVEKAALETNNSYGAIVAAVAATILMGSSLIPQTKGHDFIGVVAVQVENKCGHIRTAWTTFPKWKVDGVGTLTNDFVNSGTHTKFESRLAVHSLPDPGFKPEGGVNWGDFKPAGLTDSFWWIAGGSSGSKYTFTLKSRLLTPQEIEAAEAAKKGAGL